MADHLRDRLFRPCNSSVDTLPCEQERALDAHCVAESLQWTTQGRRISEARETVQGGDGIGVKTHGRAYTMARRSEEHTSELQSLMRISYAVFCLKKKKYTQQD